MTSGGRNGLADRGARGDGGRGVDERRRRLQAAREAEALEGEGDRHAAGDTIFLVPVCSISRLGNRRVRVSDFSF